MDITTARKYHEAGELEKAVNAYQQLIDASSDSAEQARLYLELAWTYYKQGRYDLAVTAINAVKQLDPSFEHQAEIYRIKGFCYLGLDDSEMAEKFLLKSIELDADSSQQQIVIFELAKLYFKNQNYSQALEYLSAIESYFYQNDTQYWQSIQFYRGFCLFYLDNKQESEKVFEELLENSEQKKDKANALYGLAYLAFDRKDYLKTINICEAVMSYDPDFFDLETVGFMVATSFHYLGRNDVSVKYVRSLKQKYPNGRYATELDKLLKMQKNVSGK